jgi:hypothetical protein
VFVDGKRVGVTPMKPAQLGDHVISGAPGFSVTSSA